MITPRVDVAHDFRPPPRESGHAARLPRRAWGMTACAALAASSTRAEGGDDAGNRPREERSPSPGGVRTGIFGLETRGNRFVYVFDRSASMSEPEGRPLAAAKSELLRSLDDLGDVQQFSIIFYNDRLQVFTPPGSRGRLLFATDETRRTARRFVESVRASGGTRHAEALAAAFRLEPDAVFLLTDAAAEDDLTPEELERLARIVVGSRLMVVQFGEGVEMSPRLAELAARCGGVYRAVPLLAAENLAR